MSVLVSFRVPDTTARALDQVARATARSRTYLLLRALDAYLDEHADAQIALDRLRDRQDPVIAAEAVWGPRPAHHPAVSRAPRTHVAARRRAPRRR